MLKTSYYFRKKIICGLFIFFGIVCAGKNVILLCNYDKAVEYNNLFQADLVIYDEKKGKQAKDIQKECPNMQACTMLETEFLTRKPADFVAGGRIIIYTSGTSCEKNQLYCRKKILFIL